MKKSVSTAEGKQLKREGPCFLDIAVKESGISRRKLLQIGQAFEGTLSARDFPCPAPAADENGNVTKESSDRYNALNSEINKASRALTEDRSKLYSTLSMLDRVKRDRSHSASDLLVLQALRAIASRALSFNLMFHSPALDFAEKSESLDVLERASYLDTDRFVRLADKRLQLYVSINAEYDAKHFLYDYARQVHALAEQLFDFIEHYPKLAEGLGSDFANWPFLLFRRKKENTPIHIWKQMERLRLGKTSATDASRRENWNPLQRYLVRLLTEQRNFARAMEHKQNSPYEDFRKMAELDYAITHLFRTPTLALLSAETRNRYETEARLFLLSLDLATPIPEPTASASKPEKQKSRASRKEWTAKFYLPLIKLRESDLESVPAFQDSLSDFEHKTPEKSIEEGIIRALGKIVPKVGRG